MYQKIRGVVFLLFLIKLCGCTTPTISVVIEENPLKGLKKGLWISMDTLTVDDNIPYLIVGNDTNYLTCLVNTKNRNLSVNTFIENKLEQRESKDWGLVSLIEDKLDKDSLARLNKYYYLDFIKTNKEKTELIYVHGKDTIRYKHFFEKSTLSLDEFLALDSLLNLTVWDISEDGNLVSTILYDSFPDFSLLDKRLHPVGERSFLNRKLQYMSKTFFQLKTKNTTKAKRIEANRIMLYYQKNILFLFIEYSFERRMERYVVENIDSTQWDLISIDQIDEKRTWKKNESPSPYVKSVIKAHNET